MAKDLPTTDDEPKTRHPGGRPTKYRPEYAEQAKKLCALGATSVDLAEFFCVCISTINNWASTHEEFLTAVNAYKERANENVARRLYERATGYTAREDKIHVDKDGDVTVVPTLRHYPPDPTSMIFWLKNRDPAAWRDVQKSEVSGPDGAPVQTEMTVRFVRGDRAPE